MIPHKVNPIGSESSEGNLSKANTGPRLPADYVTTSCLQYDLSGSTIERSTGAVLAYCLIGHKKTQTGLGGAVPNE